jgi:hypothetical protein
MKINKIDSSTEELGVRESFNINKKDKNKNKKIPDYFNLQYPLNHQGDSVVFYFVDTFDTYNQAGNIEESNKNKNKNKLHERKMRLSLGVVRLYQTGGLKFTYAQDWSEKEDMWQDDGSNSNMLGDLGSTFKDTGMGWIKGFKEFGNSDKNNNRRGRAINPFKGQVYSSPSLRTQSFEFKFTPKTIKECQEVIDIIFAFKYLSSPGFSKPTDDQIKKLKKERVENIKEKIDELKAKKTKYEGNIETYKKEMESLDAEKKEDQDAVYSLKLKMEKYNKKKAEVVKELEALKIELEDAEKKVNTHVQRDSGSEARNNEGGEFWNTLDLTYPCTFDVEFHRKGDKENKLVGKFGPAVLDNFDVNYSAGDIWRTFYNGLPTEIDINISLKEMKIITKREIELGY